MTQIDAMTRRGAMGLLTSTGAMLVTGCSLLAGLSTYRFRMTVEVETPQGMKTGSSVLQVDGARTFAFGDQSGSVASGLTGEAVVVDLPDGPIFVLLEVPDAKGSLQGFVQDALLGRPPKSGNPEDTLGDIAELGRGGTGRYKGDLPHDAWPMMVRFRDINDSKSVERVDPDAISVKRIFLETTGDAVTTGIKKKLGWLKDGGLTLDPAAGGTFNPTFAQTVRQREFTTEIPR